MDKLEQNPLHPLRILSLDGGGVRGLSSLVILEDLMQSIAKQEKVLKIRPADNNEIPRPCDYFDLIGGTSTGGIIAVLLGRLRMDIRECIGIYTQMAGLIFKNDHAVKVAGMKIPVGHTRFSGAVLERAIKDALVANGFSEEELMWDESLFEATGPDTDKANYIWANAKPFDWTDTAQPSQPSDRKKSWFRKLSRARSVPHLRHHAMPERKPTLDPTDAADSIITASGSMLDKGKDTDLSGSVTSAGSWKKWRLRSQDEVRRKRGASGSRAAVVASLKNALGTPAIMTTYDPNARETTIWQALRATSAAPTFFEEITFGTPKMTYLDGGMGFNNPCQELVQEAKAIWPGRSIGVVVSIGTGLQTVPSVRKGASWLPFGLGQELSLVSSLVSMSMSTARVHNDMQRMFSGSSTKYYRFDVDSGMANISLQEWMKENEMVSLTEQYMHDPRQLRRAAHVGELIVKYSALPPEFEILPTAFRVGIDGKDVERGAYKYVDLDFKTGYKLGLHVSPSEASVFDYSGAPPGKAGIAMDANGSARRVLPVASDLDHDGKKEEATVLQCVATENICLRVQREGIPQGKYKIKWIVAFSDLITGPCSGDKSAARPPVDLVFSVGKPWNKHTFLHRVVDTRIAPDIVSVLLQPDAVRVRVSRELYEEKKGKNWIEIDGNEEVEVGLDGVLGFVISKRFKKGDCIGLWHFGGVKMIPVFDHAGEGTV